jgi:hypothetical protein
MRSFALAVVLLGALATSSVAREWKVRDVTLDADANQSKLVLVVAKSGIRVVRRADDTRVATIDPKDVLAIWYDDKLVNGSLGRKWLEEMDQICRAICDDQNLLAPLTLLAVAGVGYLVAEPFSERKHFVNIRYRNVDRVEWLTLGTNWFDHFWLMTDLSEATGLKWLNLPLQRTKLFWSLGDHTYQFQTWWATGDVQVTGGAYDVLLWEDGRGRGVIMLFTKQDPETPVAVAVEQVSVEGAASESDVPEYCRDEQGLRRLLRIPLKHKRLVLPVWDAACRRVREKSN